MEWELRNQDWLIATFDNGPALHLVQHVVQDLNVVGDEGRGSPELSGGRGW
jgi:hypothetical protein